jgi:hypothetical protein
MFASIVVDKPLEKAIEDWDYLSDSMVKKFTGFLPLGQNIFGVRRRQISDAGIQDPVKGSTAGFELLGPAGIVQSPGAPMMVQVATSGTPHRVRHNFGYWHINDKDELYVRLPADDPQELGHSIVIMGQAVGAENERFAWYCPACLTLLYEHEYRSGELGFWGFWKAEAEAVEGFNSDVRRRTCPECGEVHPLGYRWNAATDTPERAHARTQW